MASTDTTTADQPRALLSVEDAARALSIGRTTMFGLIKSGAIASVQIGRLRRIPSAAIAEFTARLTAEQPAA
ncbi:excisionase family DNA binding protein [Saccharothrix coeruleofusca]|uniref:helix-turn-helix domain-containing protein n=1 Tax=Saccharothrix coeruleofusca TaxID=33919 RepID=UPI001AE50274|nr:helix-turn-helix domain-containing protein [Saccharothrix coeruleofusca]MBP2340419.1 excisionase family DNA binding protein [Saccharothrix coeruleofusca]